MSRVVVARELAQAVHALVNSSAPADEDCARAIDALEAYLTEVTGARVRLELCEVPKDAP